MFPAGGDDGSEKCPRGTGCSQIGVTGEKLGFPHGGAGRGGFHGDGEIRKVFRDEGGNAASANPAVEPAHGGGFAEDAGTVGKPFVFDPEATERLFQYGTEFARFGEDDPIRDSASQLYTAEIGSSDATGV